MGNNGWEGREWGVLKCGVSAGATLGTDVASDGLINV